MNSRVSATINKCLEASGALLKARSNYQQYRKEEGVKNQFSNEIDGRIARIQNKIKTVPKSTSRIRTGKIKTKKTLRRKKKIRHQLSKARNITN